MVDPQAGGVHQSPEFPTLHCALLPLIHNGVLQRSFEKCSPNHCFASDDFTDVRGMRDLDGLPAITGACAGLPVSPQGCHLVDAAAL
jgi:hypothetical protein